MVTRITPADAGKTGLHGGYRYSAEDHPRGCGENLPVARGGYHGLGSPPRMRGKRSDNWYRGRCSRITPADAGKTKTDINADMNYRDHPRGCGENASKGYERSDV